MMRFSQRISKIPVRSALQVESMDSDLRNKLWNIFFVQFLDDLPHYTWEFSHSAEDFFKLLWHSFFKLPIDSIPTTRDKVLEHIRSWFFKAEWFDVYDMVEYLTAYDQAHAKQEFDKLCNAVLEQEMAGYRLINLQVIPITDEHEIREIELAMDNSRRSKLTPLSEHLDSALSKLADRKNPDFRNSIKESISAVESLCKQIAGQPKVTLDEALKAIESRIGLHGALKKGFLAIYGYTSDDDGIRHALIEESTCDFEDAKYMLVSCSAFINYLIVKAQKAKISL